ncbi:hypothetical protein HGRIS_008058 [Hohenbuehelia grisea]|uniref:30S ribosomal protein S17, chloroplastic n=1 Tax=Hohenbuehelia grisea TaxID=104357 RepID=A0ABR3J6U4_9AGAR
MPPMAFTGIVTKAGCMRKTVTVTVSRWATHKITGKRIERSKKYLTHDERRELFKGDTVVIRNCLPISKLKRFRLEKIISSPEGDRARAAAAAKAAESPEAEISA